VSDAAKHVSDEMVWKARRAAEPMQSRDVGDYYRAALEAVAGDIAAAIRRECSDDLLELAGRPSRPSPAALIPAWFRTEMRDLARRWTS
jgi:hypothetical protein